MPLFGTHDLTIDGKNRVSIPVSIWRSLDSERDGKNFFILPGRRPGTLSLVPEKVYQRECQDVPNLNELTDDAYEYFQFIRSNTTELSADGQGRVLLPERLLKLAGLGKEVALACVGDRMELWNRADHTEFSKQQWSSYAEKRGAAHAEIRTLRTNRMDDADSRGSHSTK
ncbi:MAG: division/cell wall cluster transcriptional repressor MraZ [Phycisphaerae bacterium]